MSDSYKLNKLTDCSWANLFEVRFEGNAQTERSWVMCSRKAKPIEDATKADELTEETGLELTRIKHISMPVFSSAGLTDESCHMVLVEAKGQVSDQWLDGNEDIKVVLLDVEGIRDLLASNKKIAAKAWGLLYHYVETGEID